MWRTTAFTFFDENGVQVTMSGQQVLDTATQLGYRYDDEAGPASAPIPVIAVAAAAPAPPEVVAASAAAAPVPLALTPVQVVLTVAADAGAKVAAAVAAPEKTRLTLSVEGIDYEASPGVYYEIYLNLPAGTTDPDPLGPHYMGNLALFAMKPHHGEAAPGGARQDYDATAVVQALKTAGLWQEARLDVLLFPRNAAPPPNAAEAARAAKRAADAKARFTRVTLSTEGVP